MYLDVRWGSEQVADNLQLYLVDPRSVLRSSRYVTAYMCDESTTALVLGWRPGNEAKAIAYEHRA